MKTIFLAISLLLSSAAAADQYPTLNFKYDGKHTGGITGSVKVEYTNYEAAKITADLDLSEMDMDALVEANPACKGQNITQLTWHVHSEWNNKKPAGFLGECSRDFAGNHYDPTFACGPASEHVDLERCQDVTPTYSCTPETYYMNLFACERGDLSGKLGRMEVVDGKVIQRWFDPDFPKYEKRHAKKWNMLLHAVCGNSTPRLVCALSKNSKKHKY